MERCYIRAGHFRWPPQRCERSPLHRIAFTWGSRLALKNEHKQIEMLNPHTLELVQKIRHRLRFGSQQLQNGIATKDLQVLLLVQLCAHALLLGDDERRLAQQCHDTRIGAALQQQCDDGFVAEKRRKVQRAPLVVRFRLQVGAGVKKRTYNVR